MTVSIVAIDGPSASGKSTVAKRVASEMGYLYVDSGSLYRGITWKILEKGIDINNTDAVISFSNNIDMTFFIDKGSVLFMISGIVPEEQLRSNVINEYVSKVAVLRDVRQKITLWLRKMTAFGSIVMEGRDIGSAVFPDADVKFYLDASSEERARRRYKELAEDMTDITETGVQDSLERRDKTDCHRKIDPLKIAQGAFVIDSTSITIDEVVDIILRELKKT